MSSHVAPFWSLFVAAAFAPVAVWILWRVQALAVDKVLRAGMFRLLRYQKTTYNIVSWFGVLLHEMSHAVFLVLGGHGITQFKVGIDAGHVTPRQVRRGWFGLLTFLLAALAPMYTAPAVILALILLLLAPGVLVPVGAGPGLAPALDAFSSTFRDFLPELLLALVGLDLAAPAGLAVFLLAVLAIPSARPSHIKGGRGAEDEGDIVVVRRKIRDRPVPVLLFALLVYGSYFALVPFAPRAYWTTFQLIWGTAAVGIALAVLGGLGWWAVSLAGRIAPVLGWIPAAAALAAQVMPRVTEVPLLTSEPAWMNAASLFSFVTLAIVLASVATRRSLRY